MIADFETAKSSYQSKEADLDSLKSSYQEIFEHAIENFELAPNNRRNLNGAGSYVTYLMTVQEAMDQYQTMSCNT